MKDHIIFDVTNANTILDSDSVGAFVRANDGTLITKHSIGESIKSSLISQGLLFKSKLAGTVGNTYSFTVVDTGGSGPLSFTEVAGAIVLDLKGLTPTIAQVVTALSSNTYVDVSAGTPTGNVVVASIQSFSGGENTNFHQHLDVYANLADGDGNPITSTNGALNVNIAASAITLNADMDGIYSGGNTNPDNIGVIAHTRSATPTDVEQIQRTTAATANSDAVVAANVHALDVNSFGMVYNGTTWDRLTGTSGSLNVNITGGTITDGIFNTAIIAKTLTLAVANTAQAAVTAPLANRKYLWLYNYDNQKIFVGGAGVSAATGFPISPGSYMEFHAGAVVPVSFVGSSGKTPEIRTLEGS